MKKILCTIAVSICAASGIAQNSAIYKAQAKIDEQKIDEANEIIEKALTDPRSTKLAEMYNMAGNLQVRYFNPEIMKAAQKQPCDTNKLCTSLDKAIEYFTKSVEYDHKADDKGKVKVKFQNGTEGNHSRLLTLLPYYNYAAYFMHSNGKIDEAIAYWNKYINIKKNPVFTQHEQDSIAKANAKTNNQIEYNLAMLATQRKDYDAVLEHTANCLKNDTANLHDLYIMRGNAFLARKDTLSWTKLYAEAATSSVKDPDNFAQNLIMYYIKEGKIDEAMTNINEILEKDPNSKLAWYMKGSLIMSMKKDYIEARKDFMKAIEIDSTYFEALVNVGVTYVNEVIALRNAKKFCLDRTKVKQYYEDMDKMKGYYKKALPYFESAREYGNTTKQARIWAPNLENVYSVLNMTKMQNVMGEVTKDANSGTYNPDNYTWVKTKEADIPATKHAVSTKTVKGKPVRK